MDLDVEIFADGHATGLRFPVQLKSTETLDGGPPARRIKRTTWNYWSAHDSPVLVVLWERASGVLWWKWAHRHDTFGSDESSETLTFPFDPDQTWNADTPAEIESEVRAWRAWAEASRHLPLSVVLSAEGSLANVPASMVTARLRRIVARFPDILEMRQQPTGDLFMSIAIGPAASTAWVSGGPSATLHYESLEDPEDVEAFADQVAADIVVLLVNHLTRFHVNGPAARLAAGVMGSASLIFHPQVASWIVALLIESGRQDDAVELVGQLIHSEITEAGAGALAGLVTSTDGLDPTQRSSIAGALLGWADRHVADGDPRRMAGFLTYNAARIIGTTDPTRAADLLSLAGERDTAYAGRDYWWMERGGYRFLAGDYPEAATDYRRAMGLGSSRAASLLADSLMFSGEYREALDLFTEVSGTDSDGPEWRLKGRSLAFLIDNYGVQTQVRDIEGAAESASRAETGESLRNVLRKDLLCGEALFKLGQLANADGHASADLFLASAVSESANPLPWINAMLRSFDELPNFIEDIAISARRFAHTAIVDMLLHEDDPQMAALIEQVFEALPPEPPTSIELRIVGGTPDEVTTIDISRPSGD